MHIPDGFLDAKTAAVTGALALAGLGMALRDARRRLPPRRVPMLGLSAAFVFAAQMLNFPVGGGTSGHLIGGVLAAALLGPSAAVIVISAVLIVQCFMFADGGITALGANIFNMAIIGGACGGAIYQLVARLINRDLFGRLVAATFAAWCATVLASISCAGQLAASGTLAWSVAFPTMAGVHALIGVGEGIITALVLAAVWTSRPDLLNAQPSLAPNRAVAPFIVYGGLVALGLAIFVSPFASPWPDGLDKTAEDHAFAERAVSILPAPMPDYSLGSLNRVAVGTSIGGAAGTIVVFGIAWLVARALVPKPPTDDVTPANS
jgi:cobalt/nickel transport system permease protein